MSERFSHDVMISLVGHGLIFLMIFVRAVYAPPERIDIRNAIRVDVVGLPEKMPVLPVEEPEAKPEPVITKPVAKPEPLAPSKAIALPNPKAKKTNAQKDALNKLKAMEAIDKVKHEIEHEKAQKPKPATNVVAGNQVAAGNALTGLEKIEYDRYFHELETRIHSQWTIPQWLTDSELKAQVLILLDERGFVTKKQFRASSGNDIFDAKVIEAIDGSSPLPPPPQRLRGVLSTSGIVLNFP